MFKKLVANLPFNPSLIAQVSFYSERLKAEKVARSMGFFLIIIAMVVQMFAVIVPPERSLAASSNHIINGLQTKDDILRAWDAPGSDVPAIYGVFGLTRDDIQGLTQLPNDTIFSGDGNDYWTIGRSSLTGYTNVTQQYKDSQIAMRYAGEATSSTTDDRFVYHRQLRAWDIVNKSGNYYKAFRGTSKATNETFWILVDCGNYTQIGKYTPPKPPEPKIEIRKSIIDKKASYNPGDSFSYLIQYRNSVNASSAENVVITDELDIKNFDVTQTIPTNVEISNGFLKYQAGNLSFSNEFKEIKITVRLKDQISSGTEVCNASRMTASNAPAVDSGNVCVGVITPCPYDPNVEDINNPNCTEPKLVCEIVDYKLELSTRTATFKTTVSSTNPANTIVKGYEYDFGDGSPIINRPGGSFSDEVEHTFKPGDYTTKVVITYGSKGVNEDKKIDCSAPISFEDDQPLGQSKTVKNITTDRSGDSATETEVKAGDILEYTLITSNSQNYNRSNIEISDYIGDVLDYSRLDEEFLKEQNGKFDKKTQKVIWDNVDIKANGQVLNSFRVKIKDPVPATNSPSSVSTDFDCKISNAYGNEITINVDCPVVKGIETLPNTGPGSSLLMLGTVTTFVGYFFFRNRLLAKELDIVRKEYSSAGGL